MVGNPQMEDIAKLTKDSFTKDTGIKVNFTILPENELRDKVTQDIATQAGQYDVATIGAYEVPIWHKNGWLQELDTFADADSAFDKADLLPPMVESLSGEDGKLYALPFYGESSFLMYNKEVMDAEGITMPERPTWDEVAQIAAKVDGARPGMKGICLRGLPGWGELFAPLTTVVNTFGGTWFEEDWTAKVFHRVPQRHEPGEGRDVVRRDQRRRLSRGPGSQQGRRQGRLRLRAGQGDRLLRVAVDLGLGDAQHHEER